jgi:flagellar hook assembly protein FlgD
MPAMRLRLTVVMLVLIAATAVQAQIAHGYSNVFVLDTVTAVDDDGSLPLTASFMSIYPNPSNPQTTIEFALAEAGVVELAVFDLRGRLIRELDNEYRSAGRYKVTWSGKDLAGNSVPAGTYFFRMIAAGESQTARVTLVK